METIKEKIKINKVFYCGINWERLTESDYSRSNILKILDDSNLIDIYGPKLVDNKFLWDGYKNYCGEIPFDGESLIEKASKYKAVLNIDSNAHRNTGTISSRIWESVLSKSKLISYENKYFEDIDYEGEYLEIKYDDDSKEVIKKIEKALESDNLSKEINIDKYSIEHTLSNISDNIKKKSEIYTDYILKNAVLVDISFLYEISPVNLNYFHQKFQFPYEVTKKAIYNEIDEILFNNQEIIRPFEKIYELKKSENVFSLDTEKTSSPSKEYEKAGFLIKNILDSIKLESNKNPYIIFYSKYNRLRNNFLENIAQEILYNGQANVIKFESIDSKIMSRSHNFTNVKTSEDELSNLEQYVCRLEFLKKTKINALHHYVSDYLDNFSINSEKILIEKLLLYSEKKYITKFNFSNWTKEYSLEGEINREFKLLESYFNKNDKKVENTILLRAKDKATENIKNIQALFSKD